MDTYWPRYSPPQRIGGRLSLGAAKAGVAVEWLQADIARYRPEAQRGFDAALSLCEGGFALLGTLDYEGRQLGPSTGGAGRNGDHGGRPPPVAQYDRAQRPGPSGRVEQRDLSLMLRTIADHATHTPGQLR